MTIVASVAVAFKRLLVTENLSANAAEIEAPDYGGRPILAARQRGEPCWTSGHRDPESRHGESGALATGLGTRVRIEHQRMFRIGPAG